MFCLLHELMHYAIVGTRWLALGCTASSPASIPA